MLNTSAFVAALALLAGCSGEDPNGSEGGGGDDTTSTSTSSGNGSTTGSGMTTTGSGETTTTGSGETTSGTTSGGSACADLMGEGFTVGDIAEDWELPNEAAQMIALYDSCGKVIFYEEGSMW